MDDRITETCPTCGEVADEPNKGFGRARLAAWRTRHQHPPESAMGKAMREALGVREEG